MLKPFGYGVILGSVLIITGVIFLCAFTVVSPETTVSVLEKEYVFICGTPNTPDEAIVGKEIFDANCTACHRLNSRHDFLKDIDKRYSEQFLFDYINDEESLIKANIEIVREFHENKYGTNGYLHKNDFSKEKIKSILIYINYRHNESY